EDRPMHSSSEFLNPEGLASSPGYTQVVTTQGKRTVYVSGQVATDSTGSIVGRDDLRLQTEQVYHNLQTALAAVGGTLGNVVKTTAYLVNLDAESLAVVRKA